MRKAKTLQSLDSISAFNDEMKRTGSDYRLIKHPEGAYGLKLAEHSIVDIPKCDESRAAWCAYFYVNANNW